MVDGIGSYNSSINASSTTMRQNVFNKTDTDGDGFLSKLEVTAAIPNDTSNVDDLFTVLDSDGDELISQDEFDTGMAFFDQMMQIGFSMKMESMGPPPPPPPSSESSAEKFSQIDTNGDGAIDIDELTADIESKGIGVDASQLFSEIDTDGDGKITSEEFENSRPGMGAPSTMMASNTDDIFGMFDTDGDSAISTEEFEAGMATLSKQMNGESVRGMGGAGAPPPPPPPSASSASESEEESDFFSSLDTDGDGVIEIDELTADIESKGLGIDASELFGKIDTDGDGQITRAESDAFRGGSGNAAVNETASGSTDTVSAKKRYIEMVLQSYLAINGSGGSIDDLLDSVSLTV